MSSALDASSSPSRRPLRLWPGLVLAAVVLISRFVIPPLDLPDGVAYGVLTSAAAGLLILVWWLFFSRAPWAERLGALGLMAAALAVTWLLVDKSIATGMMGLMLPFLALPLTACALVAWAWLARNLTGRARWATLALTLFVATAAWVLVRTGGFSGDMDHDFAWRWAPSHEDRLLAAEADEPLPPVRTSAATTVAAVEEAAAPAAPAANGEDSVPATGTEPAAEIAAEATAPVAVSAPPVEPSWSGFRGSDRAGVVRGTRIATDWQATPPVEVWRRPIGPGWSSFAVVGDRLYTQEQRGEEEMVSAYRLSTGEPVWRHADATRFWESNAGPGPRGTPLLAHGRVYTLGANGLLNALDRVDGSAVWSRDVAEETGVPVPTWGFSSSPVAVGNRVLVAAAGHLVAYDAASGERLWHRPSGEEGEGYSSPQPMTLGGVPQVVMLEPAGVVGLDPADGAALWRHDWSGYPIVQPAVTADGDVLAAVSEGTGIRRLAVAKQSGEWAVTERWTSRGLKPYFNDFVVHDGHAYGFDGRILSAIDLTTGERVWKGGRYGNGQMLLLADQDLLLILSEKGELALVRATPQGFEEVAAPVPALDGKTWNHPVLVGDLLLVRNGKEMAAFRLAG